MSKHLPVNEVFHTWQGEGCHMGKRAFFIRLHGCPLKCSFCDAAGTWHPDHVPANIALRSPEDLAREAFESGAKTVIVTGGEPAMYDLNELVYALKNRNLQVHLETSGAFEIRGLFDWVTVSPKWAGQPHATNLQHSHEWKIIVESTESVYQWWQILKPNYCGQEIWLHPEWSKRNDPEILEIINTWVTSSVEHFRAGYQLHKLYSVDARDSRSRPLVPLGGRLENGF